MGCPHSQFDKDDPERKNPEGTRDWAQVNIVMNEMAGSWSGFVAYVYDGPTDFDMMSGGPWNGVDTLAPTKDFYNFKKQLDKVMSGEIPSRNDTDDDTLLPRRCSIVESELLSCCDLRLFNDDMIQSFQKTLNVQAQQALITQPSSASNFTDNLEWCAVAMLTTFLLCLMIHKGYILTKPNRPHQNDWSDAIGESRTRYGTI